MEEPIDWTDKENKEADEIDKIIEGNDKKNKPQNLADNIQTVTDFFTQDVLKDTLEVLESGTIQDPMQEYTYLDQQSRDLLLSKDLALVKRVWQFREDQRELRKKEAKAVKVINELVEKSLDTTGAKGKIDELKEAIKKYQTEQSKNYKLFYEAVFKK